VRNPSPAPAHLTAAAVLLALAAVLAPAAPRIASAATFDPARGKVMVADSAFSFSFDDAAPELVLFDSTNRALSPDAIRAQLIRDESAAIEGAGVIEIGGATIDGFLDLRPLATRLAGRRVEARLWQQARGTRVAATILWVGDSPDPLLSQDDFQTPFILTELSFQPTGRATDDGWQEWTTGPFDFSAGAKVPATLLSFYDSTLSDLSGGVGAFDPSVRVRIDAFTIDDLGPALVPDASCTLLNETAACGPGGVCMYGRCADASLVLGGKLENPTLRSQYLDRRIFEFRTFEGGRVPLTKMQTFGASLRALADPAISTAQYWTVLSNAVQDLEDGHASAPVTAYRSGIYSGVCLHTGEADLLPPSAPMSAPDRAPLVFSAPSTNPIGSMLARGDALTAIDGASVGDWTQAARRYLEYHGDPAGREIVTAPMIIDAAIRTGAVLEFSRCAQTSSVAATPCTSDQVTKVRVDLAAIEAGVWSGSPPSWRLDYDTCDYRFHRAVESAMGKAYTFAGFSDDRGVRWVQFNGVPSQYQQGGQEWFDTMNRAFSSAPQKIILDERLGGGGSIEAVDLLGSFLVGESDFYSAEMMPQLGEPETEPLRAALRSCSSSASPLTDCGGFYEWRLGALEQTRGACASSKVAVLLGLDVSGNDFLTKYATYRSRSLTRIFGAAPTFGAFGVIWILPAFAGEFSGGSLQAQDSIFRASSTDPISSFSTSSGVPPDQIVLEKESDAVRDVDTLVEAARAWLAE
jgi:hypothetical protein